MKYAYIRFTNFVTLTFDLWNTDITCKTKNIYIYSVCNVPSVVVLFFIMHIIFVYPSM